MSSSYQAHKSRPVGVTAWEEKHGKASDGENFKYFMVHAGEVYCRVPVDVTNSGAEVLCGTKTKFSSTSAVLNHVKCKHKSHWDNIQKSSGLLRKKAGKKTAEEKNVAEVEFANQMELIEAAQKKANSSEIIRSTKAKASTSLSVVKTVRGEKHKRVQVEDKDEDEDLVEQQPKPKKSKTEPARIAPKLKSVTVVFDYTGN